MSTVELSNPRPGVTLVTLNRPERLNAMNSELISELHAALDGIAADRSCRVVVLTGEGRGFCAGLDLTGYGTPPGGEGLGPVQATARALELAGMTISDVDLVELNEAFAAQVIPSCREIGVDIDRLNVHGGAIALGHPFGSTGARITTTLLNGLQSRDKELGLETMCVGGGQGMAMVVQRLS